MNLDTRCPFERTILSSRFACSQSEKFCFAEQEGIRCRLALAPLNCSHLIEHLKRNARFVLRNPDTRGPLSHAQEMRVRAGGLLALQGLLYPRLANAPGVGDIHALLARAVAEYGDLGALPYDQLVPRMARYRWRARGRTP